MSATSSAPLWPTKASAATLLNDDAAPVAPFVQPPPLRPATSAALQTRAAKKAPPLQYVSAAHGVPAGDVEPASQRKPGAAVQGRHSVAPAPGAYVPPGHGVPTAEPAGQIEPGAQTPVHVELDVAPIADEKEPASQSVGAEATAGQ